MPLITRTAIYGLGMSAIAAGVFPLLRTWVQFSLANDSASHVILMPAISVALLYARRDVVFSKVVSSPAAGAVVVAGGLAVLLASAGWQSVTDLSFTLSLIGLVVMAIGLFVAMYGPAAARAGRFALLFLFFIIPIPAVALDAAVQGLKVGSTETVAVLFSLTGTPYHREEFVFTLPEFVIQVADQCSGIRSSLALMFTALLIGHLSLTRTWTRVALVLAIVPITILKNAIRIVTLSLLASHVHPSFLIGRLHNEGGIVFFLLALGLLTSLLSLLRRSDSVARISHTSAAPSL